MKTKTHSKVPITYAVIFEEPVMNGKRLYEANKLYRFRAQSPSAHIGDVFDTAWDAVHMLFGCIKKGTFVDFLPLAIDPIIVSIGNTPVKWGIVHVSEFLKTVYYDTLNDLAEISAEIIDDVARDYDVMSASTIEIEDGTVYQWDAWLAHNCFTEGRISVDDFVKRAFLKQEPKNEVQHVSPSPINPGDALTITLQTKGTAV